MCHSADAPTLAPVSVLRRLVAAFVAPTLLLLTACSDGPECGRLPLEPSDRRCMVNTIDEMVQKHYPFSTLRDVDLETFSRDLTTLAERDKLSDLAFLRALERQVVDLKDGHTNLTFGDPAFRAFPPFRIECIDGRAYVSRVLDPQRAAPLERGDELVRLDGFPVEQIYRARLRRIEASTPGTRRRLASYLMVAGTHKSTLEVETADGRSLSFERTLRTGRRDTRPKTRRFGRIGYLSIHTFRHIDDVDRFDRKLESLMDTPALIIDLRDNGGGASTVADAMLGRFFDHALPPFDLTTIDGKVKQSIRPAPRGRHYDGELFVLTNELSFSAANYFVQRLVRQDRATIVGRRTGGGAASPNQSVLLIPGVSFRVSSLVVQPPDTAPAETGIAPDIEVPVTPEHLRTTPQPTRGEPRTDTILKRALDEARRRLSKEGDRP